MWQCSAASTAQSAHCCQSPSRDSIHLLMLLVGLHSPSHFPTLPHYHPPTQRTATGHIIALSRGDDLGVGNGEFQGFQHVASVLVDLGDFTIQSRYIRYVVVMVLTLLFRKFDQDATDWSLPDTIHQMSDKSNNFVAETLAWDNRNPLTQRLLCVEI